MYFYVICHSSQQPFAAMDKDIERCAAEDDFLTIISYAAH
jgi:hypothetical protein